MNKTLIVALLAATLALPMLANASVGDCDSKGTPALGIVDTGAGWYVDDRNFVLGNGIWLYQETNGQGGLQRGGVTLLLGENEICTDDPNILADQAIF